MTIDEPRIGILGLGTMGRAVARGWLGAGCVTPDRLRGTTARRETAEAAARDLGIDVDTDHRALVAASDVLVIGTKPWHVADLCRSIAPAFDRRRAVLSLAAGVTTETLADALGPDAAERAGIIRVMTNTPVHVGSAMSAVLPHVSAREEEITLAVDLFAAVGRAIRLDEKHADVLTALAGSGPAFAFMMIDALADGAVRCGLPKREAVGIAAQTLLGAARMVLETERHPASLRDDVTTPAGCTASGLAILESRACRAALADAVEAATRRAAELG